MKITCTYLIKDMREVLFNSLCNLCEFNIEGGEDAMKKVKSAAGHVVSKVSVDKWPSVHTINPNGSQTP